MGITIHYGLKLKPGGVADGVIDRIRQLAMDLPFESVGDVVDLRGKACDFETMDKEDPNRWLAIQAAEHVDAPWNKKLSWTVNPTRILAFTIVPGPGSESANIGLCQFPSEITRTYKWDQDARFQSKTEGNGIFGGSDWTKYDRYRRRHPDFVSFDENRRVPTKLGGWTWGSFCKTEYADDPACGGTANFVRCHVSLVTLLERAAKLPGLRVTIDDEGHYGPAVYSDDWQEAREAGRKPTYVKHKATHSIPALLKEVNSSHEMLAAFAGALRDINPAVEAEIAKRPDFEALEFRGRKNNDVDDFLRQVATIAKALTPA